MNFFLLTLKKNNYKLKKKNINTGQKNSINKLYKFKCFYNLRIEIPDNLKFPKKKN